jgi:hypothetical protein
MILGRYESAVGLLLGQLPGPSVLRGVREEPMEHGAIDSPDAKDAEEAISGMAQKAAAPYVVRSRSQYPRGESNPCLQDENLIS